jgi:hypothetical protein
MIHRVGVKVQENGDGEKVLTFLSVFSTKALVISGDGKLAGLIWGISGVL